MRSLTALRVSTRHKGMKAAVYRGPGQVDLTQLPIPRCGDNDVLIKNICAGVCGSDVYAFLHNGDDVLIYPDHQFGHEMVSRVVEVGRNISDIAVGQRVYPYPAEAKGGLLNSATIGGYSEYVLLENCRLNRSLYLVDDAISNYAAAMIQPFTVGAHAARQAQPQPGQSALVFGSGIIGIATAVALRNSGVEKIMLSDLSALRLAKAGALGFATCISSGQNLHQQAKEYFGPANGFPRPGVGVDIFVDAVGNAAVLDDFYLLAKEHSKLVVVGVHHGPASLDLRLLSYAELNIIGSRSYDHQDVATVLEMMSSNRFDLDSLVTDRFSLDDIVPALRRAAQAEQALKVCIEYE